MLMDDQPRAIACQQNTNHPSNYKLNTHTSYLIPHDRCKNEHLPWRQEVFQDRIQIKYQTSIHLRHVKMPN